MELAILNVGLDVGVISPALFSIMVLMALVTTAMTSPLLSLLKVHGLAPEPDSTRRPATRLAVHGDP